MLKKLARDLFRRRDGHAPEGARSNESVSPRAWLSRGRALLATRDYEAALECFMSAATADAGSLDARLAVANTLADLWRVEDCLAACAEAARIAPHDLQVLSSRLLYSHYAADPDPQHLLAEHRAYDRIVSRGAAGGFDLARRRDDGRLRIGYVSRNFSMHSVGYFIEPVIEHHDRRRFEVHCYYTHPQSDDTTRRIARKADAWSHVHADDDEMLARRIHADAIDILVDLGGHTKANRLGVFARKPAPVQITWLGYADTTGMATMDYRITDDIADPAPTADALNTERLLRLDAPFLCYRPPDDAPAVTRRDGTEPVVFGCCNALLKINPPLVVLWARILLAVPGSRMLIKTAGVAVDEAARALMECFTSQGVDETRIELRDWTAERVDHLAVYDEIDIALDTFPYNGTTTTCEALWMGVPVVSRRGNVHMSRVGATLLATTGLAELVAEDGDGYVAAAVALARDRNRTISLREGMRRRLSASALLDHAGFTRRLEDAYARAWEWWSSTSRLGPM